MAWGALVECSVLLGIGIALAVLRITTAYGWRAPRAAPASETGPTFGHTLRRLYGRHELGGCGILGGLAADQLANQQEPNPQFLLAQLAMQQQQPRDDAEWLAQWANRLQTAAPDHAAQLGQLESLGLHRIIGHRAFGGPR